MATASLGLHVLRRGRRAVLTGAPIGVGARASPSAATSSAACSSGSAGASRARARVPIATQLGMGVPWAVVIGLGTVLPGVWLHLRRSGADTEPACDVAQSPPATRTTVPGPA